MKTFVFQGDSITDAGRNRNNDNERGVGYPTLVAASMGYKFPGEFRFINRGVSGDRIVDVNSRIKRHVIFCIKEYLFSRPSFRTSDRRHWCGNPPSLRGYYGLPRPVCELVSQ